MKTKTYHLPYVESFEQFLRNGVPITETYNLENEGDYNDFIANAELIKLSAFIELLNYNESNQMRLCLQRRLNLFDNLIEHYKRGYDPNQPRVPAGSPEGGQWAPAGGASLSSNKKPKIDMDKAIDTLRKRAKKPGEEKGECATYVRIALEAGGAKIIRPVSGKDDNESWACHYGPSLEKASFEEVLSVGDKMYQPGMYQPVRGDVVVIQPYKGGKPYGHIQMYDSQIWISDWKQGGFWAGRSTGYEKFKPPFKVYRYNKD